MNFNDTNQKFSNFLVSDSFIFSRINEDPKVPTGYIHSFLAY